MARVRVYRKGNAKAANCNAEFPLNLVMHPGTEHPQDADFESQYLCLFKDGYWMVMFYIRNHTTCVDPKWEDIIEWARLPNI